MHACIHAHMHAPMHTRMHVPHTHTFLTSKRINYISKQGCYTSRYKGCIQRAPKGTTLKGQRTAKRQPLSSSPRTHPIYKINTRRWAYFYWHAAPWQKTTKERMFQRLNWLLQTVKYSLVSFLPIVLKMQRGAALETFLCFLAIKEPCHPINVSFYWWRKDPSNAEQRENTCTTMHIYIYSNYCWNSSSIFYLHISVHYKLPKLWGQDGYCMVKLLRNYAKITDKVFCPHLIDKSWPLLGEYWC